MTERPTTPNEPTRIEVSNLAASTTEVQLRALFLAFGPVIAFERPLDAATGRPGTDAYVQMESSHARRAVPEIDGHELKGQPIHVRIVTTTPEYEVDLDRSARSPKPRRVVLAPSTPADRLRPSAD